MKKPPSDHIESADVLLDEIPSALSALQNEYKECVSKLAVSSKFRAQTQAFLGHLRSVLDFLAHELVRFCSHPPTRVYFPIAGRGVSQAHFESELSKKWLPAIDKKRADIFDYLIRLQYFYPGNDWLPAFHELSNKNKHVKLSRMAIAGCHAVLIRFDGRPVMQIGDRGYESIIIQAGASLTIRGGLRRAVIHGPQIVNRNTERLLHADAGLDIVPTIWTEFKFDEFPSQPAIVFLETAEREVRHISERLKALL